MKAAPSYFQEFSAQFAASWNRFWFAPRDPLGVCLLRVIVGLAGVGYLLSHSTDLVTWFGPRGLLPVDTVQHLTGAFDPGVPHYRFSFLNAADAPALLWIVHVLGILVLMAFTVGFFSRISAVLSLAVVLSYVHRAPMLTGPFEPVLSMLIFYLCLAPCGACWSVDRWRARRKAAADLAGDPAGRPSVTATISTRLIQVHLAGLYLMMGLSKLGSECWWMGDAVWWLMARVESRPFDLTFLGGRTYLINFWTHAIVLFELAWPLLIWQRRARPLLLGAAVVMWSLLALLTGLAAFCVLMLAASFSFLEPAAWRSLFAPRRAAAPSPVAPRE